MRAIKLISFLLTNLKNKQLVAQSSFCVILRELSSTGSNLCLALIPEEICQKVFI